ncbi:Acg family FMN-binding oxidoreductase [Actinoplanes sp. GCM10030250]|uniref:Acg family FMN-binding oxidoreductase n=1 Tax=Actinoplanes sp. GCM10030250 TaxID=3273376 RepID=UPI003614ABD8
MRHETMAVDRLPALAFADAATAAGNAPSILNTQPWLWRVHPNRLDLFANRDRRLTAGDPQGRQLTLSCGAALHHARIALAADGWAAHVTRLPKASDPDLLATLVVSGRTPVTMEAIRLAHAMHIRHTDRRLVIERPIPEVGIQAIAAAARAEGNLHILTADDVADLGSAAGRAAAVEAGDAQIAAELMYWTGRTRLSGTGLPASVLPDHPTQTSVPGRDFGRPGTLPVGAGHDRAAVYALLFGDGDGPLDWLHAGESLSAAWLTATTIGVSVVPLSGVVEVAGTCHTLRRLLAGLGHPYLALRLGIANPEPHRPSPRTPRLTRAQVVDDSAVPPGAPVDRH